MTQGDVVFVGDKDYQLEPNNWPPYGNCTTCRHDRRSAMARPRPAMPGCKSCWPGGRAARGSGLQGDFPGNSSPGFREGLSAAKRVEAVPRIDADRGQRNSIPARRPRSFSKVPPIRRGKVERAVVRSRGLCDHGPKNRSREAGGNPQLGPQLRTVGSLAGIDHTGANSIGLVVCERAFAQCKVSVNSRLFRPGPAAADTRSRPETGVNRRQGSVARCGRSRSAQHTALRRQQGQNRGYGRETGLGRPGGQIRHLCQCGQPVIRRPLSRVQVKTFQAAGADSADEARQQESVRHRSAREARRIRVRRAILA